MDGWLPILFLAVILKVPVFAGMYIVWYAVKAEPETEDAPGEGDHGFRRWRREPTAPRGPRRDPHGGGVARSLPACPPDGRMRITQRPAPVRVGSGERNRGESR